MTYTHAYLLNKSIIKFLIFLFLFVLPFVCFFVSKEKIFVCKFKFSSSFSTFLSKSIEVTVYRVSMHYINKETVKAFEIFLPRRLNQSATVVTRGYAMYRNSLKLAWMFLYAGFYCSKN